MNYRDARLTPVTRVEPVEYVNCRHPRPKWPACPSSLTRLLPKWVREFCDDGVGTLHDWPRRAHSNPCRTQHLRETAIYAETNPCRLRACGTIFAVKPRDSKCFTPISTL